MRQIVAIAAGVLLALPCGFAQQRETGAKVQADKEQLDRLITHSKVIGFQGIAMGTVTGVPYSAEEVTTFSQTLGDGTRIQRETKIQVYRDGQGRVRRDSPNGITIMDPVAGASYSLDPKTKTGQKLTFSVITHEGGPGVTMSHNQVFTTHTTAVGAGVAKGVPQQKEGATEDVIVVKQHKEGAPPLPPAEMGHFEVEVPGPDTVAFMPHAQLLEGAAPGTVFYKNEVISHSTATPEKLPQQAIEGVLSEGTRITDTIPAGAIGNDRPIQTVNERWYSPELKTFVMTRRTDPRNGDETFKLTNVQRSEPSPDLFQVPAGYQISAK